MKSTMSKLLVVLASTVFSFGIAHATVFEFDATLSGPGEFPPNISPGTGFADVFYNDIAHTLEVNVTFSGLLGTSTISHIHAPTAVPFAGGAGVATETPSFAGFPAGVTSGTYTDTFDLSLMSSFNAPFVAANGGTAAGAELALISDIFAGKAYLNIHSSMFPGGEIRGFLTKVPDATSTALLLALGLSGIVALGRRIGTTGKASGISKL
jgi:hypothetical protein